MEFTCTYSSINYVNKFEYRVRAKATMTASKRKRRKSESNGRGEVNSLHWEKSGITQCESTVSFPFGNGFALNWHERSTMAATITRTKITVHVSRLRRTRYSRYDYVVTQMDWKKVELCAQNSLTRTHIPNYFVTKVKHANAESFSNDFFAHSRVSRWIDGKAFPWSFFVVAIELCRHLLSFGCARKHKPLNDFVEDWAKLNTKYVYLCW